MNPQATGRRILQWSELEECGRSAFDIWVDQPELSWAQEAWKHLTQQGLASYANELERCRVKIRFLALAGIYHDWCYVAWQEPAAPTYVSWAHLLDIAELRVGQLLGIGNIPIEGEDEEDQLFVLGLTKLISLHREEVLAALLQGYGDISDLFVSLWNSNKIDGGLETEVSEDDVSGDAGSKKESAYEVLNLNIDEKGPAYTWLDQGAEELLDYW